MVCKSTILLSSKGIPAWKGAYATQILFLRRFQLIDTHKRFERAWKDLNEEQRAGIDKRIAKIMYFAGVIDDMTSSTDSLKCMHVTEIVKEILKSGTPNK